MEFCRFCRCGMARKRQDLSVAYEEANRQGEEDGTEEGSGGVRAEGGRTENRTGEVAGGSASAIEARARRRRGPEAMTARGGPFSRSYRRGWTDGATTLETGRTVPFSGAAVSTQLAGKSCSIGWKAWGPPDVRQRQWSVRQPKLNRRRSIGAIKRHAVRHSFMFHYRLLGCLGAILIAVRCSNLLHSVHKLLHALARRESGCRLFTNCLQIVAPRQNGRFGNPVSRLIPAIAILCEGATAR